MFLVLGITGKVGGAVARYLLDGGTRCVPFSAGDYVFDKHMRYLGMLP